VCNEILDQILDHSKNLFDWNQNFTFSPNFVQFRPLYNFLSNSADALTELETSKSLTHMNELALTTSEFFESSFTVISVACFMKDYSIGHVLFNL